ncbi:amino acid adenylation domain-containing protein [Streptomyces fulvoviolaceus]|uniref:amino acid adenylation domain-containing protein n=1 Tax=Streptomyces fulvoviolaceus TaxID=285535 RepID=UPI0021C17D22|nr:non-ribosomal peptide synthetase [Streptomyces fulvoviolaceus]MCT9077907.1 amino acid adenylation domain-containing protein [Streptomyces fulvoviolaceus]
MTSCTDRDRHHFVLEPSTVQALSETALRLGTRPGSVLQAAWATLVARHLEAPDVFTHVTTRDETTGTNARVVCTTYSPHAPFAELVRAVDAEATTSAGDREQSDGVRVAFRWNSDGDSGPVGGNGDCASAVLEVLTDGAAIECRLDLVVNALGSATARGLADELTVMLTAAVADPSLAAGRLPLLTGDQRGRLLRTWSLGSGVEPRQECFTRLFDQQVRGTPHSPAVTDRTGTLDYAQVQARSMRIATALRAAGAGRDRTVAVLLDRGADFVVAMLSVLRAGAAFVLLDPARPSEHHARVMREAGCVAVISCDRHAPVLDDVLNRLDGSPAVIDARSSAVDETDSPTAAHAGPCCSRDALAYLMFTSGSTGKPKGAMVENQGMVAHMEAKLNDLAIGCDDVVAQTAPPCFDIVVWQCLAPLLRGARVQVVDDEEATDPLGLVDALDRLGITVVQLVPAMLRSLVAVLPGSDRAAEAPLPALRWMVPTGDALPEDLVRLWFEICPDVPILNTYGSTECSDDQCHLVVRKWSPDLPAIVPIGRPVPGTSAYVLDEHGEVMPVGVPGELHIGGIGVGRGYLGRPDLTAAKFVPDPFAGTAGASMYRTGDKVRWRPDGLLEFLGRIDLTVKVRGLRVEVDEIERIVREHPDVHDCVVVAYAHAGDVTDRRLAAYTSLHNGRAVEFGALRDHTEARLPKHMRPTAYVVLDALPVGASGKVDRKALPPVTERDLVGGDADETPETELETVLAELWADNLGLSRVPLQRTFMELGGHSVLAARLVVAVQRRLGVRVSLADLFRHPTVRRLAEFVEQAARAEPVRIEEHTPRGNTAERNDAFELTPLQQAYWVGRTDGFELGGVRAHIYLAVECAGLDLDRAEEALRRLIERHDVLRLVIENDGRQKVLPTGRTALAVEDLRGRGAEEIDRITEAVSRRMAAEGPSPERAPQLEVVVHVLDDEVHRVHLSLGLLAADGYSEHALLDDWLALYRDPAAAPEQGELTYRDYVTAILEGRVGSARASWEYWKERLRELPSAPELPVSNRIPARAGRFTRRVARLEPAQWAAFKRHAAKAGVTPSAALLTVFAEVLAHWAKTPWFTLNVLSSWRLPEVPGAERVVGNLSSTLPLEVDCRGAAAFADRCRTVQARLLQDLQHGDVDGVRVAREAARVQGWSQRAVFPVVFASVLDVDTSFLDDLPFDARVIDSGLQTPQVYLDHQVYEYGGALVANWDTVDAAFPEGFLGTAFDVFNRLLESLAEETSWETSLASSALLPRSARIEAARSCLTLDANCLLHTPFFSRAGEAPHRTALVDGPTRLTYGQLAERAETIANWLIGRGAGPGDLVPVVARRGWEQIAAVLGVLRAGAAYLPIDAGLPAQRIRHLLSQATKEVALTQSWAGVEESVWDGVTQLLVDRVEPTAVAASAEPRQTPRDTAYVIFTSGSTGLPKGVEVDHRGAVNTVRDVSDLIGLGPEDRVLGVSSLSFDLSVYDVFGVLSAGAALVLPDRRSSRDPALWAQTALSEGVTVWNSVPALMEILVDHAELTPAAAQIPLHAVMMSGDWIPVTLPDRIRRIWPDAAVISMGGATEASIWSVMHRVGEVSPEWRSIPYGRAMTNQRMYVLDHLGAPRPHWATGEIAIGGVGLARGYWRDPERTAERFVRDAATGERLYLTGDQGRVLPDSTIEFLGRDDFQVKINGFRIELGEIDAALSKDPSVRDAVASVRSAGAGGKSLIAHVVPAHEEIDLEALRRSLESALPPYMVPTVIHTVPALPLTYNGKVDRKALATAEAAPAAAGAKPRRSLRPGVEVEIGALFAGLLDRTDVTADDDFFQCGGNSFLAIRLTTALSRRFGVEVSLSSFFARPTPGGLAALIEAGGTERTHRSPVVTIKESGTDAPFFCVHPVGGTAMCYAELAHLLPESTPFHGIEAVGLGHGEEPLRTIEDMARTYLAAVRAIRPEGPYLLGGWSMGGLIAFEMARQLADQGAEVAQLVLIDAELPDPATAGRELSDREVLAGIIRDLTGQPGQPEVGAPLLDAASVLTELRRRGVLPEEISFESWERLRALYGANLRAIARYRGGPYDGPVRLIQAATQPEGAGSSHLTWLRAGLDVTVDTVPGDHYSMWAPEHLPTLAAALGERLGARVEVQR